MECIHIEKKYMNFHEQLMSITLLEKLPATELGCGGVGGGERKKRANGRAGASKILFRLQ